MFNVKVMVTSEISIRVFIRHTDCTPLGVQSVFLQTAEVSPYTLTCSVEAKLDWYMYWYMKLWHFLIMIVLKSVNVWNSIQVDVQTNSTEEYGGITIVTCDQPDENLTKLDPNNLSELSSACLQNVQNADSSTDLTDSGLCDVVTDPALIDQVHFPLCGI